MKLSFVCRQALQSPLYHKGHSGSLIFLPLVWLYDGTAFLASGPPPLALNSLQAQLMGFCDEIELWWTAHKLFTPQIMIIFLGNTHFLFFNFPKNIYQMENGCSLEYLVNLTEYPSCSQDPNLRIQVWSSKGKNATSTGHVDLNLVGGGQKTRPVWFTNAKLLIYWPLKSSALKKNRKIKLELHLRVAKIDF